MSKNEVKVTPDSRQSDGKVAVKKVTLRLDADLWESFCRQSDGIRRALGMARASHSDLIGWLIRRHIDGKVTADSGPTYARARAGVCSVVVKEQQQTNKQQDPDVCQMSDSSPILSIYKQDRLEAFIDGAYHDGNRRKRAEGLFRWVQKKKYKRIRVEYCIDATIRRNPDNWVGYFKTMLEKVSGSDVQQWENAARGTESATAGWVGDVANAKKADF